MAVNINSFLALTIIGSSNKAISSFVKNINKWGANILEAKMSALGEECAMILLVEGNWGAIAKIETNIQKIQEKLGLIINTRRLNFSSQQKKIVNYAVHTVTIDRSGIIDDLLKFFNAQRVAIEDIHAHTYNARSGTKMASITMHVNLSADINLSILREKFMHYCDALNLDASLEPVRD